MPTEKAMATPAAMPMMRIGRLDTGLEPAAMTLVDILSSSIAWERSVPSHEKRRLGRP
jgi:hypothetical protein